MKQTSSQTVKLLNEERALLMSLAAKRDASYSDVLRLGLYQLAKLDGLHAQMTQAVWARIEHVLEVALVAPDLQSLARVFERVIEPARISSTRRRDVERKSDVSDVARGSGGLEKLVG